MKRFDTDVCSSILKIWSCFAAAAALTLTASAAGPGKQNDFAGRRVLIIGIDGCRRDVMQGLIQDKSLPNMAALESGAHAFWSMEAGGPPKPDVRNQPTISAPGWSTLFTGVFANKHGVTGNGKNFTAGNFKDYPHYFSRIRAAKPGAWLGSIVGDTWPEVNSILVKSSGEKLANCDAIVAAEEEMEGTQKRKLNDGNLTKEAIRCLKDENPDVLFMHFLDVDHAGHGFGFGPDSPVYVKSLKKVDDYVGQVLEAMKQRPQFKDESWLIVVTTDHGGLKKSHGGQSPEEREIFTFFNGPGFQAKREKGNKVFQSLVAPTVLNYLKLPIDPAWGMEDKPLEK